MKNWFLIITFILRAYLDINAQHIHLSELKSPVLFHGDEQTAYRDPAVLYHNKVFHLFFTLTEIEPDGKIYSYTAYSRSTDLIKWSVPRKLTARDQNLGFSSPGNIIRYQREWILCLQTYPRPDYTVKQMPRYGDQSARIYIMRSRDFKTWSDPELLKVKGPDVPVAEMGRMIDPFLLQDKDDKKKYWCFYKQNGVSMSWSYDLKNWTYSGHTESGENVCVLIENNQYVLFHSPKNGIGIKRSNDMKTWTDWGSLITLGQKEWDWAKGRITAGAVIKLPKNQKPTYLMFFHGSGPLPESQYFDKNASIGIAWSDDLKNWEWPGKSGSFMKTD
jgi:hypothetical protein